MNAPYYSPGKLLLTGEYFVLDQAMGLALPTRLGQQLKIQQGISDGIIWRSLDAEGHCWYQASFTPHEEGLKTDNDDPISQTLLNILTQAQLLNPDFLYGDFQLIANAILEFPQNWGLGSSATLINNIAQWAHVSPYLLNDAIFGGSGYDIATARHQKPLLYKRSSEGPWVKEVAITWPFTDALFFVHLNQKQDSRQGIAQFKNTPALHKNASERISAISQALLGCEKLSDFEQLLLEHEELVSQRIKLPTVKHSRFSDYPGVVKSLGAWGGDFVLATGSEKNHEYFKERGFTTLLPYREMMA